MGKNIIIFQGSLHPVYLGSEKYSKLQYIILKNGERGN